MMKLQEKNLNPNRISIAPMLEYTDAYFRFFFRFISKRTMLYTEMIPSIALIKENYEKFLKFNEKESPLILQLGGNSPEILFKACLKIREFGGYQGINLNLGCPSQKVQAGCFGLVLRENPSQVVDCYLAMAEGAKLPISIKTRIAIHPEAGRENLYNFTEQIYKAGCQNLIVHARYAHLKSSPKENRGGKLSLDYEAVYKLKENFPKMFISINGDVRSEQEIKKHLKFVDGVMIGRWAYGNTYAFSKIDQNFFQDYHSILSRKEILEEIFPFLTEDIKTFHHKARHLMGLFHACPNAKEFKNILSENKIQELEKFIQKL